MRWVNRMTGMPDDATGHIARITIIGNNQLIVHYAKGLQQFTSEEVRIQLPDSNLLINGKSLEVKELLPDEIIVEGPMTHIQIDSQKGTRFG